MVKVRYGLGLGISLDEGWVGDGRCSQLMQQPLSVLQLQSAFSV